MRCILDRNEMIRGVVMRLLLGTILFLVLVMPAVQAQANSDEVAFKRAMLYTVKIKARVQVPFIGDRKGTQIGAGFVVDARRGWVMTNAHVVARSPSEVKVLFRGGEYLPAHKLYVDPYVDFAIVEISRKHKPKNLQVAQLECQKIPAVGHAVGAFGHPWNLSFTGTKGIISGVTAKYAQQTEMIQTDAPINPGNSGGPLISLRSGKVVGLSTASRRFSQNTNFAVPMTHACRILRLLQRGKNPSPPELPYIFYRDVDETNKLIVAKSHHKKGGIRLQEGDIIKQVVGVPGKISNRGQLTQILRGRLGDVRLKIVRNNKPMILRGKLRPSPNIKKRQGIIISGLLFSYVPWKNADDFIVGKPNITVHYVERGSIGDAQKIRAMDILVAVNGRPIKDLAVLKIVARRAQKSKREIKLRFIRIGSNIRDNLFSYVIRPLKVENIKLIGQGSS